MKAVGITFSIDRATADQTRGCLISCDSDFTPPLSSRVSLSDYAEKLVAKGTRFEAWCGDELIGLVAAYLNATDRHTGFVSSVCVVERWTKKGIASHLIDACIQQAEREKLRSVELEVDRMNIQAIQLYAKKKFSIVSSSDRSFIMQRDFSENAVFRGP